MQPRSSSQHAAIVCAHQHGWHLITCKDSKELREENPLGLELSSSGYMGSIWPAQVDALDLIIEEKLIRDIGLTSIFIQTQNHPGGPVIQLVYVK